MTVLLVDAEVLMQARFGTSRLAEAVGALGILDEPQPRPWHQAWRDRHLARYRAHLAANPVAAALVANAYSRTWIADFLTLPPARPDLTLDEELAEVAALPDEAIRADLERVRAPLPGVLDRDGLAAEVVGLLHWVWDETIAEEWPRRYRLLRADMVSRLSRFAREGWSGVVRDMRPGMAWLGDGRLQIDEQDHPPLDIRGCELILYATHCRAGWVTWRLPDRFGVCYPVAGIFAGLPDAPPDALVRLLGPARSRVLMGAAEPVSTSGIVAATGMPLGTVGGHLQVLHGAGLLHRRRSGREVLYWWSDTARDLIAGTNPG